MTASSSSTRTWVVRLAALTIFNLVVLLLIVLFLPGVRGLSFGLLWAALLLTAATIWIKPLLTSGAQRQAVKGQQGRSAGQQRGIGALAVFVVAFVIWLLLLWFTNLHVVGWFWGYVLPPLALLAAWFVYDAVDDKLEGAVGGAYDSATRRRG